MKTFLPATGSEAEWNAAYYRVEDYLRALGGVNRVHQSQIIIRLLAAAAEKHAAHPDESPAVLAMEEARAALDRWFSEILPRGDGGAFRGLTSLLAADASGKWPDRLLAEDIPIDFQLALQANDVRGGPDLNVSSMAPRPFDAQPLLDIINLPDRLLKAWRHPGSRLKSS